MTNSRTVAAVLAAFLLAVPMTAVSAQEPDAPVIDIRATAVRKVVPDQIYVEIRIDENDYKGKKTLEELQKTFLDVLKKCKIDLDEDLRVKGMQSSIRSKAYLNNIKTLTRATYVLRSEDVSTVQKVIDLLGEEGISNVCLTKTDYSDKETLELELGQEAMKKAQNRAVSLAGAIGQKVGDAVYVYARNLSGGGVRPMYLARSNGAYMDAEEAVMDSPEEKLTVNEIEYSLEVNVKFRLLGKE